MAQWLQMEIAKKCGVAANFQFPMPSSFIWKLYADNLPNVSTQNPFEKDLTLWRLMRLIPTFLQQKEFEPLKKIFSVFTCIRTAKTLSIKPKSCRFYLTNISSIALNGLQHGKKIMMKKSWLKLISKSRAFRR